MKTAGGCHILAASGLLAGLRDPLAVCAEPGAWPADGVSLLLSYMQGRWEAQSSRGVQTGP